MGSEAHHLAEDGATVTRGEGFAAGAGEWGQSLMDGGTSIESLTQAMFASYRRSGDGCCSIPRNLPSKGAVARAVETLRSVLFPGYFGGGDMHDEDLKHYVAGLLIDVRRNLAEQVSRALAHAGADGAKSRAKAAVSAFMANLPHIRELLMTDIEAAYDGDPAASGIHEIVFAYPGISAITAYRLAHELHLLEVPLIPRMMTEHAHSRTGIDIHPGASVGHHFFIDHGTGIVIGETTVIGNYAKIYQGVTLGALSTRGGQTLRGKKRHPTLGETVTVYSSASILGGETHIGDGAVIGANAFVTRSVPAGARVSMRMPELSINSG